jgi:hypothetical protein
MMLGTNGYYYHKNSHTDSKIFSVVACNMPTALCWVRRQSNLLLETAVF